MVISLEQPLTAKWQADVERGHGLIEAAEQNIARIALIYSGQMSFDQLQFDSLPPEAA